MWLRTSRRAASGSRAGVIVSLSESGILPVHPHPKKGELFSSWLLRLAHGNGLKVHSFCSAYFGVDKQIWNRNIDVFAPDWLLEGLAKASGIDTASLEATTLRSFEGSVFERINRHGSTRWLLPAGVYHRLRKSHGQQYCPVCLLTDQVPYFRAHWCLAFYTECEVHHVLMRDACHQCDAPVVFFRGDIGHRARCDAHLPTTCWQCGADLMRAPALSYPWPDWRLAVAFRSLLTLYWVGWSFEPLPASMYSHLLYDSLHQICRLLAAVTSKVRLPLHDVERDFSLPKCDIDLVLPIERHRIVQRHHLLVATTCLLMEWPSYFRYYSNLAHIPTSLLQRDMHSVPNIYRNVL
ncbi:TniQ family protein [Chitinibacteraceae bacterium HSL-7]